MKPVAQNANAKTVAPTLSNQQNKIKRESHTAGSVDPAMVAPTLTCSVMLLVRLKGPVTHVPAGTITVAPSGC